MVASGLPISNGTRHAEEISTMALHFLSAIKRFKIRHLPNEKLALRIGINSGMQVHAINVSLGMLKEMYKKLYSKNSQSLHTQAQWLLELWVVQCQGTVYLAIQ